MNMSAEEWRRHQEEYSKYGIDMSPSRNYREEREKRRKAQAQKKAQIAPGEKLFLVFVVVLVIVCMIAIVGINAASARVEFNINKLLNQQNEVSATIDNLQAKMVETNSIDFIESYAQNNLGLIYPSQIQYVYVEEPTSAVDEYVKQLSTSLMMGTENKPVVNDGTLANIIRQGNTDILNTIQG